jgi:hypothetical protein
MVVEVEAHAGYKAQQEPRSFVLKGRRLLVLAVVDRWIDPDADYFRVRADDGAVYLLRYDRSADVWMLVRSEQALA